MKSQYSRDFLDALCTAIGVRRPRGAVTLVGIDGPGSGGKTTLAEELAAAMADGACTLGTDEFLVPLRRQSLVRAPGEDLSITIPHLRWTEIEALVTEALPRGSDASYRPYRWPEDAIGGAVVLPRKPIVIVEGLYALHGRLRRAYDFRIWVDGRREDRMQRAEERMIRDGLSEGDRQHWIALWNALYVPRELAYIAAQRPHDIADLFVLGSGLHGTRESFAFSMPNLPA